MGKRSIISGMNYSFVAFLILVPNGWLIKPVQIFWDRPGNPRIAEPGFYRQVMGCTFTSSQTLLPLLLYCLLVLLRKLLFRVH